MLTKLKVDFQTALQEDYCNSCDIITNVYNH